LVAVSPPLNVWSTVHVLELARLRPSALPDSERPAPVKSLMVSPPIVMAPAETTNPPEVERPAVARPPAKVEVAVEVEVMEPVVSWPIDEEAKKELTKRPMVANSEVEVALVVVAFVAVSVEMVVEPKVLAPVKMLLSAKSVEDANDHVEVEKL